MSYDQTQVAFIDTETTGLDPEYHVVWEIAVITDGNERVWQQKVGKSGMANADRDAMEMTRFHERYGNLIALDPNESVALFNQLTGGRHLVGACPWFDSERLHRLHRSVLPHYDGGFHDQLLARRHPWHYHLIDVETLAVGYLTGKADIWASLPWKSEGLSRAVGVEPNLFDRHTALGDARWAKAMFEAIMGAPE